ncbi:hypothetical protein [Roseobacter sinensis]|uniref:Dihydroorotate dehydrogenase n=1 Tax=Roseobacter sinensis TaxID=2931391 RepID=A0ABT3BDJ9_9RHOB|nr:hypothetical protein [Roseobacter sp. WL0113]MCV3271214.1 hypothetical protein [Roseobacter sp. WL0113]
MTMKKPDEHSEDAALDALLDAARTAPPEVPDALMARVLADADRVQPSPAARAAPSSGLWSRISDLVGGWRGMGGLVAATCAGVWIGWSPPDALPDAGALILGYEAADILSNTAELTSFGWDVEEG